MGCCSAPNCSNSTSSTMKLYSFPTDPERRKKWIANCRRDKWEPTKGSRICQIHFEDTQFERNRADGWVKLKPNAIPTLFNIPDQRKKALKSARIIKKLVARKTKSFPIETTTSYVPTIKTEFIDIDTILNTDLNTSVSSKKETNIELQPTIALIKYEDGIIKKFDIEPATPTVRPTATSTANLTSTSTACPTSTSTACPTSTSTGYPTATNSRSLLKVQYRKHPSIQEKGKETEKEECFQNSKRQGQLILTLGTSQMTLNCDVAFKENEGKVLNTQFNSEAKTFRRDDIKRLISLNNAKKDDSDGEETPNKKPNESSLEREVRFKCNIRQLKNENRRLKACVKSMERFLHKEQLEYLTKLEMGDVHHVWSKECIMSCLKIKSVLGWNGYKYLLSLGYPGPAKSTLARRLQQYKTNLVDLTEVQNVESLLIEPNIDDNTVKD